MKKKLEVSGSKTLKLTNVVRVDVQESDFVDLDRIIIMLDNYIKSKGALPIGPIVQYAAAIISSEGHATIEISFLRQSSKYIKEVEIPYIFVPLIRVTDCIYVSFNGKEEDIQYALDKLKLFAYEEDILLANVQYTVFIDRKDETIIADIFMEKAIKHKYMEREV